MSPVVAGWELALRLRERRVEAGINVRTITEELGFSRNYWSAVENERKVLSEESLTKLLDLLDIDQDERRELLALRTAAKERGWWSRYSALFDGELQRLFGLEFGASRVRCYESGIIPGLLQTGDYARAIMAPSVTVRSVEVDQRVELRLRRQERLDGDHPLPLTAVIGEATLRQQIGGPAVLRRQLEHLADVIEEHPETVEVRVIPFTATASVLFGASTMCLIDFERPRLPTVVWQETVTTWGLIDDPDQVRDIAKSYDDALQRTLSGRDSLGTIHRCIKETV
ncbi:MAG: helix-turn-helix domain-containing protein [Actinophytocola sp.]|uniref:Scr1 family TA system antitoxin-like transcriptional regulator n=1 Tax=Actinophytocola sp. TaxID=1872138 RepID=UPI001326FCC1|nr:Scr1 family TA system antitoxin-like transcriptional regulator [Actinophytocola sp.]MPZ83024.1 helix-turn-helix domain-containing protein [Actinophytocola sp.]